MVVVTGQGGVWESRSNLPCLLFVSAGLIDEKVGEAQQRPPTAICALHRSVVASASLYPPARVHWRQVARSLVPDLDTYSPRSWAVWAVNSASMAKHRHGMNRGSGIQGAEVSEALSTTLEIR